MTDLQPAPPQNLGEFTCRTEADGERLYLRVAGELDMATAPEVEEHLANATRAGFEHVVLDLAQTTFVDSSGLRAALTADRDAKDQGATLTVANCSAEVMRAFTLAGLQHHLRFDPAS